MRYNYCLIDFFYFRVFYLLKMFILHNPLVVKCH